MQPILPVFYFFNNNIYHVASLTEYHNFSPTLMNELRLGYNRSTSRSRPAVSLIPGLDAFPNIPFNDTLNIQIGPDPNAPQGTVQNTYQLMDNFTWIKGAHTFQFGFDGRKLHLAADLHAALARRLRIRHRPGHYRARSVPEGSNARSAGAAQHGHRVYYGDQYATYEYAQDTGGSGRI